MMTDELKPVRCGCGGEAIIHVLDSETPNKRYYVICKKCGTSTWLYLMISEAIEAWNRAMSGVVVAKNATTERTAKAEYSNADGEYLCKACGRVVQIEDAYCCGCGCRLEWE